MSLIDKLKRKKESTEETASTDASVTKKTTKEKHGEAGHHHAADAGVEFKAERAKSIHGHANRVLVKPLVTEKSARMESAGTYTFMVDVNANKILVKQAIKDIFGVVPTDVRIMNVEGKRVRFAGKEGKRRDAKKAIVTLPKGQTIQIHAGV